MLLSTDCDVWDVQNYNNIVAIKYLQNLTPYYCDEYCMAQKFYIQFDFMVSLLVAEP